MNKSFIDLLERAQSWPEYAREQLEEVALEIEAELANGTYRATPEDLASIDRGLRDSAEGRFATAEEIEATFAKFRRPCRLSPQKERVSILKKFSVLRKSIIPTSLPSLKAGLTKSWRG